MKWFEGNWKWAALNLFALAIVANVLREDAQAGNFNPVHSLLLINSGKWALRFLLVSLAMTPLSTLFGWRGAVKLRKPAGLWAFELGLIHLLANIAGMGTSWLQYPIPDYFAALGVIALTILTLMAATSYRWAMKYMGSWWKRLHRLVYAAGMIVVLHALLESSNKRVVIHDAHAAVEIWMYAALLVLLLAVRIPAVRSVLAGLRNGLKGESSLEGRVNSS